MSDELVNAGVPGQERAARKLLEADGDVLAVVEAQRIAGGRLDVDTLKLYLIPILLEQAKDALPFWAKLDDRVVTKLVGRAFGVAMSAVATAIEAERAWLEEQGA